MTHRNLPRLETASLRQTREALHAWCCVLGDWLKAYRHRRKHWWHSSLRPSLGGWTTGVVRAETDFELEIDLLSSRLHVRTPLAVQSVDLVGQSPLDLGVSIERALIAAGIDPASMPGNGDLETTGHAGYSRSVAAEMQAAAAFVAAALERFRAGIREETSPIQLWPHHFDLAMVWLPGPRIAGKDPNDEEQADKQMNFGFVFGDSRVEEPYFYVTAYPLPDALAEIDLPKGTAWNSDGFDGALLLYSDLVEMQRPGDYLHTLWTDLLSAGQRHIAVDD